MMFFILRYDMMLQMMIEEQRAGVVAIDLVSQIV